MKTKQLIQSTLVGLSAGLISTWIMTKSQGQIKKVQKNFSDDQGEEEREDQDQSQDEDPSTVKLANKVSNVVVQHPIPEKNKPVAGQIVHYGFGASMGALYGALNYKNHRETFASGVAYGVLVWLVADNMLVPLMGLSKSPLNTSMKTHLYALGSHLVYGASLGKLSEVTERRLDHGTA